jgi:hypothetical protein
MQIANSENARGVSLMGAVKFLSTTELQRSVGEIKTVLADDVKIILTINGKPTAVMIGIEEANFEETLAALNQVQFSKSINAIRSTAQKNGTDQLSMEEIDAEIALARQERRQRKNEAV